MKAEQILNVGISAGYNVGLAQEYGVNEAIVLNRLIFLHRNTRRKDGFTWQTAKDWYEHTGLSNYQVKRALDHLAELGIIEAKNTYIIGTQTKCRHQRFLISHCEETSIPIGFEETSISDLQETSQSVNSIEHNIEHSIEHKNTSQVQKWTSEAHSPSIKKKVEVSEEAIKLSELLRSEILRQFPNNVGAKKETCVERWAVDIDRMIRIDHRSPESVRDAILWAMDDEFWRRNIWSGAKLRKQYDRLDADARAGFLKHGTITVGGNDGKSNYDNPF